MTLLGGSFGLAGSGDYQHLPLGIALGLTLTLSTLWVGQRHGMGLTGVWWALTLFYSSRLFFHLFHHFVRRGVAGVFGGGSGSAASSSGPPLTPAAEAAAAG